MTDTISDEARTLAHRMAGCRGGGGYYNMTSAEEILQQALTAARMKALEDAAECVLDESDSQRSTIAEKIRAMKVQP